MAGSNEDDKATVILDLDALKKQKIKQEEDLANLASELEFNIPAEDSEEEFLSEKDNDQFIESFLDDRKKSTCHLKAEFPVILLDFQSDFFSKSKSQLPEGFVFKNISTLEELNQCLRVKSFQIVVLNYDSNPKAINQLSTQIKQKFPFTKSLIVAKGLSPDKAKIHAASKAGANGYFKLPLESDRFEKELLKIKMAEKKVS